MNYVQFEYRELVPDHAAAMAELNAAVVTVDRFGELTGEAEWRELFRDEGRSLPPLRAGFFTADGRLAAFSVLVARDAANPVHRMFHVGMVHPEFRRRGIGTELTRRAVAAAPGMHAKTFPDAPLVVVFEWPDVPGAAELAAATGFEPERYSFFMERELPREPDAIAAMAVTPDEGLKRVPFDASYRDALFETHLAAFVPDHPGATAPNKAMWDRRFTFPTFRADISSLMIDEADGTIAGYILVNEPATEDDSVREIHFTTIATRREYRRRGIAGALIAAGLVEAAKQGYGTATLDVDSENPTGALKVYQRAGFEVTYKSTAYVRGFEKA